MSGDIHLKREIVRSTSIVGGATVAALLISLVKMKVFAVAIGPAGVGLLGTLNALMLLGAAIAGMGIDASAVRQLSSVAGDKEQLRNATWALWLFAWPLAIVGSLIFWAFQTPISKLAFGSPEQAPLVGWVSLGIGASVTSAALLARVQAFRLIGQLAKIRLVGSLFAAIVSIAAVLIMGFDGIALAVIATPFALLLAAWLFRPSQAPKLGKLPTRAVLGHLKLILQLGTAITITATVGSITQASIRAVLIQSGGLPEAGLYQASFAISSLNIGLLFAAMVPEYYPRLSAAGKNVSEVNTLLNQQLTVALLFAAPALLAISAFSPVLLSLLYSKEFLPAANLLRWQVAADGLRILGWALGYVLLARKHTIAYILFELVFGLVCVPLTWLVAPLFGVTAAGAAYFVGYATSVILILILSHRDGVKLSASSQLFLGSFLTLLVAIAIIAYFNDIAAMIIGALACAGASLWSLREFRRMGLGSARSVVSLLRNG